MFEKNEMRQFPTTEDKFIGDKKMDDRIYGYMQANSYLTEDKTRYCWKTDMSAKNIKSGLEQEEEKAPSENTIRNNLKLLQAANLISEGAIGKRKTYVLAQLVAGEYVFIKTKTLRYLNNISNGNVIKVYAFLKQKQEIHKKSGYEEQYSFSENSLLALLGYNITKPENHTLIQDILNLLVSIDLIHIHQHTKEVNGNRQVMYYFLDAVNEDYKEVIKKKPKAEDEVPIPVIVPQEKEITVEAVKAMSEAEIRVLIGF